MHVVEHLIGRLDTLEAVAKPNEFAGRTLGASSLHRLAPLKQDRATL